MSTLSRSEIKNKIGDKCLLQFVSFVLQLTVPQLGWNVPNQDLHFLVTTITSGTWDETIQKCFYNLPTIDDMTSWYLEKISIFSWSVMFTLGWPSNSWNRDLEWVPIPLMMAWVPSIQAWRDWQLIRLKHRDIVERRGLNHHHHNHDIDIP